MKLDQEKNKFDILGLFFFILYLIIYTNSFKRLKLIRKMKKEESGFWSLYKKGELIDGELGKEIFFKPLKFSNGKNQEDIVKEVISAIKNGKKIIFIKGVCGSGKSAMALNLAKNLGRASIVVPVKNLQKQYEDDYTNKKYVLKNNDKEKLKISVISGRANFKCPFLEENKDEIEDFKSKEKNSSLDIFDNHHPKIKILSKNEKQEDLSCNNEFLPCKIEIKSKNLDKIKKYLRKNPRIKNPEFLTINDIRRLSIAPVCKYWSPIVPEDIELSVLTDANKLSYQGLQGIKYNIYSRKQGCGYYDQFKAYVNSDVIIFNSAKYLLEVVMNRKPASENF